jgi:hypothetical protein
MQLNDEQKKTVTQWVKDGSSLSEVQKRLAETFGLRLTYIDVRLLVLDLGVNVKDPKAAPPAPKPVAPAEALADESLPGEDAACAPPPLPGSGSVSVDVDRIMRPGALVSGTVVFSDGVKATWALDQMGRLALGAENKTYRPSAEDIQQFQQAIARELQKRGY